MTLANVIRTSAMLFAATTALAAPAKAAESSAVPMTLVVYQAGPSWKQGQPPEQQNLGPHFGYVGKLFKEGRIVAFGPQTDAVLGYYVLRGSGSDIAKQFAAGDPGIKDNVFKMASELPWAVAVNGFAANVKDSTYFILRYKPGKNWVSGKPVTEQDIGAHFGYMVEQAKKGVVLAAGPSMAGDEGIYVVTGDKAAIKELIANDPGVKQGIFEPQTIGWNVLGMQAAQ
jgi:uncharacterized protein YciI